MTRLVRKLRVLGSELLLIPRIWRALVQEAREDIAWDSDVAVSAARREMRATRARH